MERGNEACNHGFFIRPSKYGWKPEILKKGVMEEAPTIVCRPIISHIPCINTRDYYWYLD
ncbi:hypothetical protein HanXRQr2_Chr13g0615071 [Helianthus annuus]|uniref:Uncharacterized protein n=1 Tax=Helianthus annuus TaxID=4232 RepID=A0A251T121_HELAN|nr:hypothetical protein HanXRQr2_Chr13g0615071 [Helianthus annuus]